MRQWAKVALNTSNYENRELLPQRSLKQYLVIWYSESGSTWLADNEGSFIFTCVVGGLR